MHEYDDAWCGLGVRARKRPRLGGEDLTISDERHVGRQAVALPHQVIAHHAIQDGERAIDLLAHFAMLYHARGPSAARALD